MSQQARFTLKVGEIYRHVEKGLEAIDEDLAATGAARLSNLPNSLLERWVPHLVRVRKKTELFWRDEGQKQAVLAGHGEAWAPASAVLPSKWYQEFIGERLPMGEVLTDKGLWHLLYREDGTVRRILANTDNKCNPCIWRKNFMMRFEGEHLYATVYDRIEGLKTITDHARKGAVYRAVVIPPFLLKDIVLMAKENKADYKFILSRRDPLARFFQAEEGVRYGSSAKIYYVYGEQEATVGSLRIDADYYSIFWRGNQVFNVMKFNNRVCSNCLSRVFDTAWKYSEKV